MRRKSIFVLLLALVLVFTACSANSNNSTNNQSTGSTGTPAGTATPAAEDKELSPDEKPTLKWLINSSFYDLEDDAGASITREVAGYNIEFEVISGVDQLMLIISSGEPYDYVFLTNDNYNL